MKSDDNSIVGLSLFTNIKLKDWQIGKQIISVLYTYGPDIAPQQVDYGEGWKKISASNYLFLASVWPKLNNILFKREDKYKSQLAMLLGEGLSRPKPITLWVDESYYSDQMHVQGLLDISIRLYELIHPVYGLIHNTQDKIKMATFNHPKYGETVLPTNLEKGLPGIYWANFFGPKLVESLGMEKLLSAPWFNAIKLSDGGFLTLTESSPLVKSGDGNQLNELQRFLGVDNFYSVVNNDL